MICGKSSAWMTGAGDRSFSVAGATAATTTAPMVGTTSRLLRLLDEHGAGELDAALTEAQRRGAFAALSVAHILDQRRRARGAPVPIEISLSSDPRVQNLVVMPHSLARYDRLGDNADSAEKQVKP